MQPSGRAHRRKIQFFGHIRKTSEKKNETRRWRKEKNVKRDKDKTMYQKKSEKWKKTEERKSSKMEENKIPKSLKERRKVTDKVLFLFGCYFRRFFVSCFFFLKSHPQPFLLTYHASAFDVFSSCFSVLLSAPEITVIFQNGKNTDFPDIFLH